MIYRYIYIIYVHTHLHDMQLHVNQILQTWQAPCRWQSQCGSFQGGQTVTGWLGCTHLARRLGDAQDMRHQKIGKPICTRLWRDLERMVRQAK